MFKHKIQPAINSSVPPASDVVATPAVTAESVSAVVKKEFDLNKIGELLEKDLKWSQIIYEQNRRINHKLLWMAVASWLRFLIIAGSIALAVWYTPTVWRGLQQVLGNNSALINAVTQSGNNNQQLENIFKLLPLNGAQQEQVKAILK